MTTVKTKVAPLVVWTNGMFRDLRYLALKRQDLRNFTIVGASKALLLENQKSYVGDLVTLVQKTDAYFAHPTDPNIGGQPADIIDGIQSLEDEINADLMLCMPEDMTDVRDIVNFDWLADDCLAKLFMVLSFCELHKCSSIVVAIQSLTIKLVWLFAELVDEMAHVDTAEGEGVSVPESYTVQSIVNPAFQDVLERFGCQTKFGDYKMHDRFHFVCHGKQIVLSDSEMAQKRADDLAERAKIRREKELRDRMELSVTYGTEIVKAFDDYNAKAEKRFVIPDQSTSLLLGPVDEAQCQQIDDLSVFLRSYSAYAYPDKEYNGDRQQMFADAIKHMNEEVIIKGETVIAQLINMVTPKVVIHSLNLLGNGLQAQIMSTKDILADENEQYVYDFRLGTPIQIRKAN